MEVPRHWRLRKQRYALVGEICPHCETKIFPPRDICPICGGDTRKTAVFSARTGQIPFTGIEAVRVRIKPQPSIPRS
ncbi:MAG: zinc ribbon domain-containing protein [Chloroflexota bacterium]|nr:zinc ribbon domain-containing protein [Chloroflexota bacterium]